jgi:hypothetical protein
MAKYRYTGTDERVFPSLGLVVEPNDEFDAPDDFVAYAVEPVSAKISAKPTVPTTTMSAAPDTTQGV